MSRLLIKAELSRFLFSGQSHTYYNADDGIVRVFLTHAERVRHAQRLHRILIVLMPGYK